MSVDKVNPIGKVVLPGAYARQARWDYLRRIEANRTPSEALPTMPVENMRYAIRDGSEGPIVETIAMRDIVDRIDWLSGRTIGRYIMSQFRSARPRVYVACNRGCPWHDDHHGGFVVERIDS